MPGFVPLVSFAVYTQVQHQQLTVPVAFAVINILGMLQDWITSEGAVELICVQLTEAVIPDTIKRFFDTLISIRRVERFLAEPDLPELPAASDPTQDELGLHAGSFAWAPPLGQERSDDAFRVTVPDVRFSLGTTTLVTGPTASGKSTFLLALLGELETLSGDGVIRPRASRQVAYCAQNVWLEHATIRHNILFGSLADEQRLNAVVDACALRPDIDELESGVETEIGEHGVTLSGPSSCRPWPG